MYDLFLRYCDPRIAVWAMAVWYAALMSLVLLSFSVPAGEFRYGSM